MRLNLSIEQFSERIEVIEACFGNRSEIIQSIVYDTRKISSTENVVFFALEGPFRTGVDFIQTAYELGIRNFVIPKGISIEIQSECNYFTVNSGIEALQKLAKKHRLQFKYPVVAVTGSIGKTTVKEWLYFLLSSNFSIIRSPKSYNSQLGVALSLLELNDACEIAIIEAGISEKGEMQKLEEMIQPTFGILTAFSNQNNAGFASTEIHFNEFLQLFDKVKKTWASDAVSFTKEQLLDYNIETVIKSNFAELIALCPFRDPVSIQNLTLVLGVVSYFIPVLEDVQSLVEKLPRLAMRMETFEGINNTTIINDAYNLDLDALEQSLEFQKSISGSTKRIAILSLDYLSEEKKLKIHQLIASFSLNEVLYVTGNEIPPIDHISNATVLIKGARSAQMQRVAGLFYLKKHVTQLEINLSAVRHNVTYFRRQLQKGCGLMAMVKASSYGSGALKMSKFLEDIGIEYLGVAYVDEGVELRKHGIQLPILVMNAEEFGFEDIVKYRLEPTIYSFSMLDSFIRFLITNNIENYPVHIEFDTGMKRLGFDIQDVNTILNVLQSQPEIKLKSIFSHLAESDNAFDTRFTNRQVELFQSIVDKIESSLSYSFMKHICNSEGILSFPNAHFDMVRLGIGMYGYSAHEHIRKQLQDVITWRSVITQLKYIKVGESIGYSRTFVAAKDMQIAIVPIGYADGFRKSLSNGQGGMFVSGAYCPVVGNVCMDMTMIDVTHIHSKEGDSVEIIGPHQSLIDFAKSMNTIPYEVLTSISSRVQRIYSDD